MDKTDLLRLKAEVIRVAKAEIGNGELGKNNSGKDVARYSGGKQDVNWCAYFVGYCYETAAKNLGITLPFARSAGAKAQCKNIGKCKDGIMFSSPEAAMPGDVVCWNRGLPGSWTGHIGLVMESHGGLVTTIEGNAGAFPSKVRVLIHDVRKERLFSFAGLRTKP